MTSLGIITWVFWLNTDTRFIVTVSASRDLSDHRVETQSPVLPVWFHSLNFSLWRQVHTWQSEFLYEFKIKACYSPSYKKKAGTHMMIASRNFRYWDKCKKLNSPSKPMPSFLISQEVPILTHNIWMFREFAPERTEGSYKMQTKWTFFFQMKMQNNEILDETLVNSEKCSSGICRH